MRRGTRTVLAVVVILTFALVWNGVVHMVLLREADALLAEVARPPEQRNLLLSLLLTAGLAGLFVYSHTTLARVGSIWNGLRHGAFFGLLAGLLVDLNQYLLFPIPASLAASWFAFGFVEFCTYGVIAAWICPVEQQGRLG